MERGKIKNLNLSVGDVVRWFGEECVVDYGKPHPIVPVCKFARAPDGGWLDEEEEVEVLHRKGENKEMAETINYNDGNWHGWQGGECPVHKKSIVSVLINDNAPLKDPAGEWEWKHKGSLGDIVAFKVEKEYKEPKELWVYGDNPDCLSVLYYKPACNWKYIYKVVEDHSEST